MAELDVLADQINIRTIDNNSQADHGYGQAVFIGLLSI